MHCTQHATHPAHHTVRNCTEPVRSLLFADMSRAASVEPDFYTQSMNVLCPLDDECLPLEAANLKTRQVRWSG